MWVRRGAYTYLGEATTTVEAGALHMQRDYINTLNLATFGSKPNVNAPRWESVRAVGWRPSAVTFCA